MKPDETPLDESSGPLFEKYHRALEERDFDSATEAVGDIFALAVKWCEENPSPDFDLTIAAGEFEECADWRSAESMYERILSLPDITPGTEYKAHSDLAKLCQLLHRHEDALDHARRATAATRRDDFALLLLMALESEAWCLNGCDRVTEALALVAEAFTIMDHDETCDLMRAQFLTLRAECAVRSGSLAKADPDLEQAHRLLEPLSKMEIAAGVHGTLACWWSVTARLRAERDDRDGAVSAWRKAVEISKHVDSLPQIDNVYSKASIANMLKGLAEALSAADRTEEAAAVLDEREELLERIGIPDPRS